MSAAAHFLLAPAWPILLLAPAAAVSLWLHHRVRSRRLEALAGPRGGELAELRPRRRVLGAALFSVALLLALVALLQPAWGESARSGEERGIDLVVCLDVSRSMLAEDLAGSRLAHARDEIRGLAERAAGDRIGLVVFAGEARLAVPMTRDLRSLADLAGRADPLSVTRGGTDLGAAITAALEALPGRSGQHATILLLTDGEDHEESGLRAARACAERGLAIHCLALGSELGAKIPRDAEEGGGFLRDRSGREVVAVPDFAGLSAIAETAGGEMLTASASGRSLVDLYERRVLSMARESVAGGGRREGENRFQWPLLAALLLWILELCLIERQR